MKINATNAKCMNEYANSYYNKYLTLNAPNPDDWMVKHNSHECKRNIVDYEAIDQCVIDSNFKKQGKKKTVSEITSNFKQVCEN